MFFFLFHKVIIGDVMHLSDLQSKDIINIKDGKKVGNIIDVILDSSGNLDSLVVQKNKLLSSIFLEKMNLRSNGVRLKK